DGKMERAFEDGGREVLYRNGTRKEVRGGCSVVRFVNGDVKRTEVDAVVYYYAEARTTHTTQPSTGMEVFEFPNGQVEKHDRDGTKEILFPDGTRKVIQPGDAAA
ncbi:T-complex protein 10, C-terminal domain-containing protein, partial [Pelagophyceae sp. CCMP2097]